jgi:eukaryotic-like serine/threonine-protein kinase
VSLRFLLMAENAAHRSLLAKHIEVEWSNAAVVEHALGSEAPLDPQFEAAGFDAVIIVSAVAGDLANLTERELASRTVFAPIVTWRIGDAAPPAVSARITRLSGRKLDRVALIDALSRAARDHKHQLAQQRSDPAFADRYQFGPLAIRGHRCIKQIGTGGMCTVFLAESERAAALVVLKVFSQVPDVSERLVSFDRFLQEYEIVARLRHQNIVRIYDLGVADDHAYIAMEHFSAGDLRQRMKSPIAPPQAQRYIRQMASALEAIHSVGVLHRDLKPANVMLRRDGSICLIDFGLAKAIGFDAELTGAREIFGTPYYMSPEQGHAEASDERSDLYSVGVIFYEMLTGRKPYVGNTAMEVIYKHRRAPLPELPPPLQPYQAIVHRLLAKSPADRYQSAHELLDALGKLDVAA